MTILNQVAGTFSDPAKGKEIALAQIAQGADVVFPIAGGTGLAPILSIARDALSRGLLRKQRLDIFIGVRTPADIFATASLQELIEAAGGAVRVTWAISEAGEFADWKGERGYVHEVVARSAGDLSARQVYMGGPPAMIDAMVRLLLKSRVKRSQIRFDKFA